MIGRVVRCKIMAKAHVAYPDAKSFSTMIESLAKIVDEIAINVNSERLAIRAIDPAQVALIEVHLPSEAFLEFEVEEEVTGGVNIANALKLIKRSKKGDKLEIDIDEEYVIFKIMGATLKRFKFRNLAVSPPEIPELGLEFNVHAVILSDVLKHALKDAETVGDTAEFDAREDMLIIRGKGASTTETKIAGGTSALIELEIKEPSKSAYSIEYLKHILALTKIADAVTVEFSSTMPLKLEFPLPAGGKVMYLLAPKTM